VSNTHTTQISNLTTTSNTHTSQIAMLDSAVAGLQGDLAGLQGDVGALFDLRKVDRRDMKQGVAAAMAFAQAPIPSEAGRLTYALTGARFRGENAVSASVNYRLPTSRPAAIGVGFSYAGNKNTGVRIGVSGEF
jgi:hypothetical protein